MIRPEGAGHSLRAQRLDRVGGQMRCIRRGRAGAMLAVQAAALAGAANLWAGIAFDPTTSSLKITHDANVNDPNDIPFAS